MLPYPVLDPRPYPYINPRRVPVSYAVQNPSRRNLPLGPIARQNFAPVVNQTFPRGISLITGAPIVQQGQVVQIESPFQNDPTAGLVRSQQAALIRQYQAQSYPLHVPCSRSTCDEDHRHAHYELKTKDITVRGLARAVRASYLTESPKFKDDLVKYLDKKKEEQVPDRVVDLLVSFINYEKYQNEDLHDEVTLCILAHNVGAKSAVEHSLARIKSGRLMGYQVGPEHLCDIIATIMLSSKVDDGLKKWLGKYLESGGRDLLQSIERSYAWEGLTNDHPEVVLDVLRLLGQHPEADDDERRVL